MAELMEARVPDIGSDGGVPVIELLVKVGDSVAKDQGLVTLESDKATMEVPSPFAGIVRELKVKIVSAKPRGVFDRGVVTAVGRWRFQPIDQPQSATRTITFEP